MRNPISPRLLGPNAGCDFRVQTSERVTRLLLYYYCTTYIYRIITGIWYELVESFEFRNRAEKGEKCILSTGKKTVGLSRPPIISRGLKLHRKRIHGCEEGV